MPFVSRWGSNVKTEPYSDWLCGDNTRGASVLAENLCPEPAVLSAPTSGPGSLSAGLQPPASGPSSLVAGLQPPVSGPSSLALTAFLPPVLGPSSLVLAEVVPTLNIAPLETDESFADDPSSGSLGEIRYSSDTEYLYIHNGTEWHRYHG